MQQQHHNFTHTRSKIHFTPSEVEPLDISNSTYDPASEYGVYEQRQAFESLTQEDEHQHDEDNAPGWKATNYPRRKVQKGWWAMVALSALLFFLLGIGVARLTMPLMRSMQPSSTQSIVSKPAIAVQPPASQAVMLPPAHTFYFFMNPTFTTMAREEVATALHLTPEQITIKMVNANYGLSAVAADQGIRFNQLYSIEQHAVNDMLNAEIQAGYIHPDEATAWKNLFWNDPGKLDIVVGSMFSGFPVDISY
jgi:hypothetical protein